MGILPSRDQSGLASKSAANRNSGLGKVTSDLGVQHCQPVGQVGTGPDIRDAADPVGRACSLRNL
jgi:hypothetical protein